MLAAPLVCVVGFQNSEPNKGAKRRRNNRTLTGLCVAIRKGRERGAHLSCSLYFSKPSLTYPSIIEKQGDSIHHACCGLSPWFERHAKDWNRATGLSYIQKDFLCCYCYSFFNSCPFALCMGPVNFFVNLSHRLFLTDCTLWSDAPKKTTIAADIWIRKDSHRQQEMLRNRLVRLFGKCRKSIRFLN